MSDPRFPRVLPVWFPPREAFEATPNALTPNLGGMTARAPLSPSPGGGVLGPSPLGGPALPTMRMPQPVFWVAMAHQYAYTNRVQTVTSTAAGALTKIDGSIVLLEEPTSYRNFLFMRNTAASGGSNIYIDFGMQASASSIIRLEPTIMILLDTVVPQDDIYAFADGANASLVIQYGNVELPPRDVF